MLHHIVFVQPTTHTVFYASHLQECSNESAAFVLDIGRTVLVLSKTIRDDEATEAAANNNIVILRIQIRLSFNDCAKVRKPMGVPNPAKYNCDRSR